MTPYIRLLEAELLMTDGMPEEALSLLNSADFGDREPLSYGLLRGALELELRRFAAAQDSVLRLRKAYPDNLRVFNFCTVTYLSLEQLEEAEICIEAALAQSPTNVQARLGQAMLLKKRGSFVLLGCESIKVVDCIIAQMANQESTEFVDG